MKLWPRRPSRMTSTGWCDVDVWDGYFTYLWGMLRRFRAAWDACWRMYEKTPRGSGPRYALHSLYVPVCGKNLVKVYRFRISMN